MVSAGAASINRANGAIFRQKTFIACWAVAQAIENCEHGHIGKGFVACARKDQIALATVPHLIQNRQRLVCERDTVVLVHLHPLTRDRPNCAWPIDLGPASTTSFVRQTVKITNRSATAAVPLAAANLGMNCGVSA
jgi:hypothetical protein